MTPKYKEPPSVILIIDDNVEMIRLLSGMLKDQGQILFATNGKDGIEIARQRQPQLILLDVEMPEMNGYEVCQMLKNDVDTQNCAIVFVTASANMESEVAALDAGAVDFITKPLNPPVVRARVRTHLKLHRNSTALAQLANRDGLTGFFNRRFFNEQFEQEFLRHKRQKLPLGLAFIDIDYFKLYNDHYGHLEGDACLCRVAETIELVTRRPGEVFARYGGEEFVTILPYLTLENTKKYGEWLCTQVSNLNLPHAHSVVADHVTISVGLASMVPGDDDTAHMLLNQADQALYLAKSGGRNCAKVLAFE